MKAKASTLLILFGLILSACIPEGTPAGGPDLSKVGPIASVSIVSASASPASIVYPYDCGSTFVPPVDITFTVLVDDPSNIGSEHLDVRIRFGFGSFPASSGMYFLLFQAGTTGTVHTYSGDALDPENVGITGKPMEEAFKTGGSGVFIWTATVVDESLKELAKTGVMEIPFAPGPCPSPMVPVLPPPRIDVTIVPPGSLSKPKPGGGGGSPPSCSVDPNNPSCVPGP